MYAFFYFIEKVQEKKLIHDFH